MTLGLHLYFAAYVRFSIVISEYKSLVLVILNS